MAASPDSAPLKWRDYSFEYKGFFVFEVVITFMFVTGIVPATQEIEIASGFFAILAIFSIYRRVKFHWRKQSAGALGYLKAFGGIVSAGILGFASSSLFPPNNPHQAAWYLGLAGMAVFNALQELKIITLSEADFRKPTITELVNTSEIEPRWHGIVRALYHAASFASFVAFAAFFYLDGVAMQDGSPHPTLQRTEQMSDHGNVVYVSKHDANIVHWLEAIAMTSIAIVLATGFALHFLAGIRMFPGGVNIFGKHYD